MNKVIEQLRLAISFLTLLPVAPKKLASEEDFSKSIRYFTLVGFIFGACNLAYLYLAKYACSNLLDKPWLIALGIVLINLILSGGLHLDGLMDCFDGIACRKEKREEILTVIKDSRVGAFGSMAGSVILLAQTVALAQIDYQENFHIAAFLLFILPASSRFLMVLIISFQVDELDDKSSLLVFKKYGKKWLTIFCNIIPAKIIAWIFIILIPLTFDQLIFCDLIIVPWLIISWLAYAWLKFKLKGHNGDSMGAGLELSESLFLVLIASLL